MKATNWLKLFVVVGSVLAGSSTLVGCVAETGDVEEDESDITQAVSFELIQQGFFGKPSPAKEALPTLIHTGSIASDGKTWVNVKDYPITYDANNANLAVKAKIPPQHANKPFAFTIKTPATFQRAESWTAMQTISPSRPGGKFVSIPVHGSAGYPFSSECYRIYVKELTASGIADTSYDGKLTGIQYGFTKSTATDYLQNNDVAWQNGVGSNSADGQLSTNYVHDGGYKGTNVLVPTFVRVPADRNLVFKLSFDKFNGSCLLDGDTQAAGSAQTKTYFVQNK